MYDEQEVMLEMYNDQYDNFNKPPTLANQDNQGQPNQTFSPNPPVTEPKPAKTNSPNGLTKPALQNGGPHPPSDPVNKYAFENLSFIDDPRFAGLKATEI